MGSPLFLNPRYGFRNPVPQNPRSNFPGISGGFGKGLPFPQDQFIKHSPDEADTEQIRIIRFHKFFHAVKHPRPLFQILRCEIIQLHGGTGIISDNSFPYGFFPQIFQFIEIGKHQIGSPAVICIHELPDQSIRISGTGKQFQHHP